MIDRIALAWARGQSTIQQAHHVFTGDFKDEELSKIGFAEATT